MVGWGFPVASHRKLCISPECLTADEGGTVICGASKS